MFSYCSLVLLVKIMLGFNFHIFWISFAIYFRYNTLCSIFWKILIGAGGSNTRPYKMFCKGWWFCHPPYKPVFKGRWFKDPPLLLIFNLLQSINFKKITKPIQKPWKFNPIIVVTSRTRKNMKIISQCIFSFRVWKSQRMGLCYSSESPILWFVHYEL